VSSCRQLDIQFYCRRKKFRWYVWTGAKTGSFNYGALEAAISETGSFYAKSLTGNAAPIKSCNKKNKDKIKSSIA